MWLTVPRLSVCYSRGPTSARRVPGRGPARVVKRLSTWNSLWSRQPSQCLLRQDSVLKSCLPSPLSTRRSLARSHDCITKPFSSAPAHHSPLTGLNLKGHVTQARPIRDSHLRRASRSLGEAVLQTGHLAPRLAAIFQHVLWKNRESCTTENGESSK